MLDQNIRTDIQSRLQALQDEGELVTGFVVVYEVFDGDANSKTVYILHGDGAGGRLYPWTIRGMLDWASDYVKKTGLA